MIKISNLVKSFGKKRALDSLNLEIKSGTIFALLGVNGAGKTTLVSILNGLCDFESGEVEISGLDIVKDTKEIRAKSSLIPQSLALYGGLSVLENLDFFARICTSESARIKDRIEYAVHTNSLQTLLDQKAHTLSGGQKRRLNIAIGLLNDPEILYLDEPTVGIDPASRNEILRTISSFRSEGKIVVYTTHYMSEVEKICDEVAIIDKGKIIKSDTLENMLISDSSDAIFEIRETPTQRLAALDVRSLEVISSTKLKLASQDSYEIEHLLRSLKNIGVIVKEIKLHSTSLENIFIDLTSKADDV